MCGLILFPSAVFLFWGGFALCSQLNALNIWMWLRLRQNLIWSLCRIFMFSDSFHLLNLSSQERKRKRQTNVYGTCKNERKSAILWSCLHCLIMIHFWTHFFLTSQWTRGNLRARSSISGWNESVLNQRQTPTHDQIQPHKLNGNDPRRRTETREARRCSFDAAFSALCHHWEDVDLLSILGWHGGALFPKAVIDLVISFYGWPTAVTFAEPVTRRCHC